MRHPEAHELALYISRDLTLWRNFVVGRHMTFCPACRREAAALREASMAFAAEANAMPADAEWDRLALEMRANIRLGLEAGECIGGEAAAGAEEPMTPASWYAGWNPARWWNASRFGEWIPFDATWLRVASAVAAVAVISVGTWWWQSSEQQQEQQQQTQATSLAAAAARLAGVDDATAGGEWILRRTDDGISVERDGRGFTLAHTGRASSALAVTTVSAGSLNAKYVDEDSGQVTIHHVYAE
ncbi:MAG: hypothetical protein IT162_08700 [Bryobacterales bacterium]|nr:hypothetical protein [Bryobacterales bacterium]